MNLNSISLSRWTFLLLVLFVVIYRSTNIVSNEISWDVFGYYLPLQATFIEDDPMLDDRTWVDDLRQERDLAGTSYFISSNDQGEPMYFFFLGMSYLYAAFFFIGHFLAGMLGYAQDGLSPPYQYALVFGCIVYTVIGLHYLRKILINYFPETVSALVMIILVLGTNYSHHMTIKNLETVNVLFMFAVIVIWNTILWHKEQKFINLLAIGVSLVMMALVKPSEILFILVPLLWGISTTSDLKLRVKLLFNHKWKILLVMIVCAIIASPQILYWYSKTGKLFYDTYKNPGVGLDLTDPHILESLVSYRKGWLLYTPIMIFALAGFVPMYLKNRKLIIGVLVPFLISFYIIASWTEYWYGAGFSNRPVITQYSLLSIPLGYFLLWLSNTRKTLSYSIGIVLFILIFMNQFQWWQFRNSILDPYRTTKEYYWATFLKTEVSAEDRELLLINRDFSGVDYLTDPENYSSRLIYTEKEPQLERLNNIPAEYTFNRKMTYDSLTNRDHCWVQFIFDYTLKDTAASVLLCSMMERVEGAYGAKYYPLTTDTAHSWQHFDTLFLTPEIRSEKDSLKFFFWNRSQSDFNIRNFKLYVHEKSE